MFPLFAYLLRDVTCCNMRMGGEPFMDILQTNVYLCLYELTSYSGTGRTCKERAAKRVHMRGAWEQHTFVENFIFE